MRISDWSSDVCSSDLHARLESRLFEIGGSVHDPARQAGHGDRGGAALADAALGIGAARQHPEPVKRAGEGRERQRERPFRSIDAAAVAIPPLFGDAFIGRNRSAVRNLEAGEVERVVLAIDIVFEIFVETTQRYIGALTEIFLDRDIEDRKSVV